MSWWPSSWLPTLPSIDFTLPSGIQKRFISFALRQTLGHFLKPGQLDIQQVDSQIGSGYVQVRDVELDNNAINALISGLPLQLHDGSVGKVTARIPLPNPLTSSVGLSLESLHLTFYIVPTISSPSLLNPSFLAESVASVADTFIHEELSAPEEATLRESFYSEVSDSTHTFPEHLPGGLDPFSPEGDDSHGEGEPPGVSLFATLVERLLSRFEFDAVDTKITIVHAEHASFTLTIPEICYSTEGASPAAESIKTQAVEGVVRAVSISGVSVTTRSLLPPSPQPLSSYSSRGGTTIARSSGRASPDMPPMSPRSDSSDMDEETQTLMSQSIVTLPPRPISPTSSVSSSMYESAVSEAPPFEQVVEEENEDPRSSTPSPPRQVLEVPPPQTSPLQRPVVNTQIEELEDDLILTLGTEPIVIRVITPSPVQPMSDKESSSDPSPSSPTSSKDESSRRRVATNISQDNRLRVTVQLGTAASALRAQHVRSLIDVADTFASHSPPPPSPAKRTLSKPSEPGAALFEHIEGSVQVRGVIIILLPSRPSSASKAREFLASFFTHPLVPPSLPHGYVRILLETVSASLSLQTEFGSAAKSAVPSRASIGKRTLTSSFTLSELSIFAFLRENGNAADLYASPILITDPHLASQYPPSHIHPHLDQSESQTRLSSFGIVDWTDSIHRAESTKLSHWRTRQQYSRSSLSSRSTPVQRTEAPTSSSPRSPAATSPSPRSSGSPFPSSSPGRFGDANSRPRQPAVSAKLTSVSSYVTSSSRLRRHAPASILQVEANVAPLHAFVDAALCLESDTPRGVSELVAFMEVLAAPKRDSQEVHTDVEESDTDDDVDSGGSTPPGTPKAETPFKFRQRQREDERERQRLERLVLDDLDLDFDYTETTPRKKTQHTSPPRSRRKERTSKSESVIIIKVPIIRLQVRGPSRFRPARSGAVVLDIHDLLICPGNEPSPAEDNHGTTLLSCSWQRFIVAYCPVHENKAEMMVSVGSLSSEEAADDVPSGIAIAGGRARQPHLPKPRVVISRSNSASENSDTKPSTLVIALEIPSMHIEASKPVIDGLQLWADDLSRLVEKAFNPANEAETQNDSRSTSIIGSRYFAKTRSRSSGLDTASTVSHAQGTPSSETIVKVTVSEVALRLVVPRSDDAGSPVRPFDVLASDLDLLLEVKPEGKDETVITVGLMDLTILDHTEDGSTSTLLALTIPRTMTTTIRSLLKLRFASLVVAGTTAKESRIRLTISGITYTFLPNLKWIQDLTDFAKAPPGVFESVVPSERTRVSLKLVDTSLRLLAPSNPGSVITYIGETEFSTVVVGNAQETSFQLFVQNLSLLLIDNVSSAPVDEGDRGIGKSSNVSGVTFWKNDGYALLAEIGDFDLKFQRDDRVSPSDTRVSIDQGNLRIHLCADTATALGAFIPDFASIFSSATEPPPKAERREPTSLSEPHRSRRGIIASLDEHAFRRAPEVGPAPDMIHDDLPTNLEYLDDSFSASAGFRELPDDDDLDDFGKGYNDSMSADDANVISKHGGETVRMLQPRLQIIEHYFDTLPADAEDEGLQYGNTSLRVRIRRCDATLFLYDGYDWARTRRIIEDEAKNMRKRLAKIRQLVANGQTPDPSVEETNTLLFNSVYLGLEHNIDDLEPGALIAAIDDELNDSETASQSSWQSFKPQSPTHHPSAARPSHVRRKALTRSKSPSVEFRLLRLSAEMDQYISDPELASRTLITVRDVEILDHIKTSSWKMFLTDLRTDSKGNIRETDSNMARIELRKVYPAPGHPAEEARLRAKILPLRLHVDQDALDFLKKFFSFKDPESAPLTPADPAEETFFQQAEVFPVDLKLDYKPRRVDYRALRDGKTIELMNFFHFDGAEMTLRHIVLTGITGWTRFFDLLNDLWTPDVKATQLVDVISGVAPIRSVVNVGSGVADLVLLPISQYRKDGRVVRGLQKGTTAFVKSTATEAIKLGARLATGTQVILEQAETVLGGQFKNPITAEAMQISPAALDLDEGTEDAELEELISRYADQPTNVKEGVQSAVRSLRRNFNSAAQTILAVPMEVYERSGSEGTVRAVVRAVPIAVLKPMIGASEAISKTLLGLHNTLDPGVRLENEAKYKQR
ncbi:unnamed protein product [Somion occarium]|uniref:Autophagy-related protein 2 n=1 Tax=Somion occarium TaxID=3059160 RepID=A0ABP1D9Z0_9APHY